MLLLGISLRFVLAHNYRQGRELAGIRLDLPRMGHHGPRGRTGWRYLDGYHPERSSLLIPRVWSSCASMSDRLALPNILNHASESEKRA